MDLTRLTAARILKGLEHRLPLSLYQARLRRQSQRYNRTHPLSERVGKSLVAIPCGAGAKALLARLIERFGHEQFDFMLFVWDGSRFDETVFAPCDIVYEAGAKFYFLKRYLTPTRCAAYDYIFAWDDDLDVTAFSPHRYLDIVRRNKLQLSQPALTPDSHWSHAITLRHDHEVGRYTDYVEIMAPVLSAPAWTAWWDIMEPDWNHWGWGYDTLARSLCGFRNLGIVDAEPVTHTRPISSDSEAVRADQARFLAKHPGAAMSRQVAYAPLI